VVSAARIEEGEEEAEAVLIDEAPEVATDDGAVAEGGSELDKPVD
jgi:hypothetical protein